MSTDPTPNPNAILKYFWAIFQQQETVMLLNLFRGLPVSFPARINVISQSSIGLSIHPYQAVCIAIEKRTYIQSTLLPFAVMAYPMALSIKNEEVVLGRLTIDNHFVRRNAMRVQPKEPIRVEIHVGQEMISGTLSDISVKGLGLFVFGAYISEKMQAEKGQSILLKFKLPESGKEPAQEISIEGQLTSFVHDNSTLNNRMGIRTVPDSQVESQLMAYIRNRRTEIMDELEQVYLNSK